MYFAAKLSAFQAAQVKKSGPFKIRQLVKRKLILTHVHTHEIDAINVGLTNTSGGSRAVDADMYGQVCANLAIDVKPSAARVNETPYQRCSGAIV